MKRRNFLGFSGSAFGAALGGSVLAGAAIGSALPGIAHAHHGWSSFDPDRPLYLKGRVKAARWRNPHVELELELETALVLPADLASRQLPAQATQIDGPAILAKTGLPDRQDKVWTIELAPLTRMRAWSVEPIAEGETVELVGYTLADNSEPVLRAEWLFRGGKAYGLRSAPA